MSSLRLHHLLLSPPLSLTFKSCPTQLFSVPCLANIEHSSPNSQEEPTVEKEIDMRNEDRLKLRFEKARAYKKASRGEGAKKSQVVDEEKENDVPESIKAAFEKAKTYRKDKGPSIETQKIERDTLGGTDDRVDEPFLPSPEIPAAVISNVEFFRNPKDPEVEILVGDTTRFGYTPTSAVNESQEEDFDLYKPKVSTWGVFPRPENISKTFGGGRNIRPGDTLETVEERAAKDKRTREMISAYKKKIGSIIDPELQTECEMALNEGNTLMDSGKLPDALPFYEQVMKKLPFKSELHGLAALQWSICKDSLSRGDEARVVYEKLQSHPNGQVRKKAKHFVDSFRAMQMMKVAGSNFSPESTSYQKYFDAFVENKMTYPQDDLEVQESNQGEILPYILFLISPVLFVLFVSFIRGNLN